ncbi:MAG: hypothetical protein A2Y97_10740 [Nitrospirae bacterium RBG_13_39_12]|nr:MAG: hypothetical protein A2Y97_10740 [Nitrospirae bacterium RBG_13_39_12]
MGDIAADLKHAEARKLPQNDRIILSTAVYNKTDIFVAGNEKDFKMVKICAQEGTYLRTCPDSH